MKEVLRRVPVIDDRPITREQARRLADQLMNRDSDMKPHGGDLLHEGCSKIKAISK